MDRPTKIHRQFEVALAERGIKLRYDAEDDSYVVLDGDKEGLTIYLDNLIRSIESGQETSVDNFAEKILSAINKEPPAPLLADLWWLLIPNEKEQEWSIRERVSDCCLKKLSFNFREEELILYTHSANLEALGIDVEEAKRIADQALEDAVQEVEIYKIEATGVEILVIDSPRGVNSSLLLAKAFPMFVNQACGLPAFVAIPNRDRLLVMSDQFESEIRVLCHIANRMHTEEPQVLTNEIFRLSSTGFECCGSFAPRQEP